jgi:hypothetical protein
MAAIVLIAGFCYLEAIVIVFIEEPGDRRVSADQPLTVNPF